MTGTARSVLLRGPMAHRAQAEGAAVSRVVLSLPGGTGRARMLASRTGSNITPTPTPLAPGIMTAAWQAATPTDISPGLGAAVLVPRGSFQDGNLFLFPFLLLLSSIQPFRCRRNSRAILRLHPMHIRTAVPSLEMLSFRLHHPLRSRFPSIFLFHSKPSRRRRLPSRPLGCPILDLTFHTPCSARRPRRRYLLHLYRILRNSIHMLQEPPPSPAIIT